ncbi:YbjN domain-containing protein [Novosphingobium sp.]|uniref:YbjN domain-containing protein n=1 Tax=Novosphingobium sp. TaxID=1874826 RepID=UPI003D1282CF
MKSVFSPIARATIPAIFCAMACGVPAFAESFTPVSATDPAGIVSVLQASGDKAQLTHDDSGDPLIKAQIGGWTTQIVFYDCNEITHSACQSLQFNANFMPEKPFDAAAAAAFVRDNRFGAVTVSPDRTVNVTWDVITGRGIDPAVFSLVVKSYRLALDTIGSQVFSPAHMSHLASASR